MIKVVAPAQRHPTNRSLADFHNYWGESHGPLFANTKSLRRYVQHLTLPEAYGVDPAPTYDGVSMFWYDEYEPFDVATDDPEIASLLDAVLGVASQPADDAPDLATLPPDVAALFHEVLKDDSQLFDRSTGWPMHEKRASVWAHEHVVVDGETTPEMVKAIFIVSKLPGLTLDEFFGRWQHHHGPLAAKVPGLRRYVQNHALPQAYADRRQTHDGWSELWFDDLASLHDAAQSAEWRAVREDGDSLFARPVGVGVARERIQKDFDWTYDDWGVGELNEDEIQRRLAQDGYAALASDADAPRQIKAAAARQALAVWTREHLVTIDDSRIDARPTAPGGG
jgi:uncharacterized protein (TIGR02118 family)